MYRNLKFDWADRSFGKDWKHLIKVTRVSAEGVKSSEWDFTIKGLEVFGTDLVKLLPRNRKHTYESFVTFGSRSELDTRDARLGVTVPVELKVRDNVVVGTSSQTVIHKSIINDLL